MVDWREWFLVSGENCSTFSWEIKSSLEYGMLSSGGIMAGSWSFWFSVDCLEVLGGMPPLCMQCTNSLYFSILVCINYQSGELNMCLGAFKDHLPCAS